MVEKIGDRYVPTQRDWDTLDERYPELAELSVIFLIDEKFIRVFDASGPLQQILNGAFEEALASTNLSLHNRHFVSSS